MTIKQNKLFTIALTLSGLVHIGLIVYGADDFIYGELLLKDSYISVSLQKPSSQPIDIVTKPDIQKDQQKNKLSSAKENSISSNQYLPKDIADGDANNLQDNSHIEPVVQDDIVQLVKELSGEDKSFLLGLLHDGINAHKQYPFMAVRQRREGLVSINFLLHPDGRISDIEIVKSSRYGLLDNAARLAVEKVSPFQMAENYLQQTEPFNVDIEFRLN